LLVSNVWKSMDRQFSVKQVRAKSQIRGRNISGSFFIFII
jgi:hypothetical protein